jgi:hypothetical protein
MLHSSIAGFVLYAWVRRLGLPSGRVKRRLLTVVLVLPLLTAAIPGRGSLEFREQRAWLDSGRILAIPLVGGVRFHHVVLALGAITAFVTVWQEVLPVLRRRRRGSVDVPDSLVCLVRGLPGWEGCAVVGRPSTAIELATSGWPWRPRLLVSGGALERLTTDELAIAVRHEHEHWQGGRWARSHALFLARLLQCYNPVALWAFREYCLEVEIECDAAAVTDGDAKILTRTLLKVYESSGPRDIATRSALRKRIDVLLGGGPHDDALPFATTAVASAILLVFLPWVV